MASVVVRKRWRTAPTAEGHDRAEDYRTAGDRAADDDDDTASEDVPDGGDPNYHGIVIGE
jgi:hypothetical protein